MVVRRTRAAAGAAGRRRCPPARRLGGGAGDDVPRPDIGRGGLTGRGAIGRRLTGANRRSRARGFGPAEKADPDALVLSPAGGAIDFDQGFERRHRRCPKHLPLAGDRVAECSDRFGRELIREDCLLEMVATLSQHVGDGRFAMIANVRAEEAEHAPIVPTRHERIDDQFHGVLHLVMTSEPEPAQFAEKAARMHVASDFLGEFFETRGPLPGEAGFAIFQRRRESVDRTAI